MGGRLFEWIKDEEGVRLFIEVINICDAKHKKTLIKTFKTEIADIVKSHTPAYITLVKLLTEVDDTVQLQKFILPEI